MEATFVAVKPYKSKDEDNCLPLAPFQTCQLIDLQVAAGGKHLVAMYTSCGYHLVVTLFCTTNQL